MPHPAQLRVAKTLPTRALDCWNQLPTGRHAPPEQAQGRRNAADPQPNPPRARVMLQQRGCVTRKKQKQRKWCGWVVGGLGRTVLGHCAKGSPVWCWPEKRHGDGKNKKRAMSLITQHGLPSKLLFRSQVLLLLLRRHCFASWRRRSLHGLLFCCCAQKGAK